MPRLRNRGSARSHLDDSIDIADHLFVIGAAQKRVYSTYGGRGTLGIRNSRNPSARVNGPPLLPPAPLARAFHLAPPRDGGHAIEQFFSSIARNRYSTSRETGRGEREGIERVGRLGRSTLARGYRRAAVTKLRPEEVRRAARE